MNILGWIATVLSLYGFYANVKKSKVGFIAWGIADVFLIVISVSTQQWYLVFLYVAYLVLAGWGYWKWSK